MAAVIAVVAVMAVVAVIAVVAVVAVAVTAVGRRAHLDPRRLPANAFERELAGAVVAPRIEAKLAVVPLKEEDAQTHALL